MGTFYSFLRRGGPTFGADRVALLRLPQFEARTFLLFGVPALLNFSGALSSSLAATQYAGVETSLPNGPSTAAPIINSLAPTASSLISQINAPAWFLSFLTLLALTALFFLLWKASKLNEDYNTNLVCDVFLSIVITLTASLLPGVVRFLAYGTTNDLAVTWQFSTEGVFACLLLLRANRYLFCEKRKALTSAQWTILSTPVSTGKAWESFLDYKLQRYQEQASLKRALADKRKALLLGLVDQAVMVITLWLSSRQSPRSQRQLPASPVWGANDNVKSTSSRDRLTTPPDMGIPQLRYAPKESHVPSSNNSADHSNEAFIETQRDLLLDQYWDRHVAVVDRTFLRDSAGNILNAGSRAALKAMLPTSIPSDKVTYHHVTAEVVLTTTVGPSMPAGSTFGRGR